MKIKLRAAFFFIFAVILITTTVFPAGTPGMETKKYPDAPNPRRAAELWADAFVRSDYKALTHFMHPEARENFKQMVILKGWELAGKTGTKPFVSLIDKTGNLETIEKMKPHDVLETFCESLSLSKKMHRKLKQTKIEIVTSFRDEYGRHLFFFRIHPSVYSDSSRLVTIGIKQHGATWKVLLSPWCSRLLLSRLKKIPGVSNSYINDILHDQVEALGNTAVHFILPAILFRDKDGMAKWTAQILRNNHMFGVIIIDHNNEELFRKQKKEIPATSWDHEFPMEFEDKPAGQLLITYGPVKNETMDSLTLMDNDIEAAGLLVLSSLSVPTLFHDKISAKQNLESLFNCQRVEQAWIQKGNTKKWVETEQRGGAYQSSVMAFEIGLDKNTKRPDILFIRYSN